MKKEKIKTERYLVRFKNRFERLGSKLFLHDPDPEMRELYEKVRKRRLWHVDNIVKKKRKELKKELKTKIRIERVFKETPLIVCKIQPELVEKLRKDPDVQSVLIDEKVEILAQEVPWGIERVKAISAHSITKGTGIKVAILDTGIDMNHEDLKDNYKGGYNVISPGSPPIDGHGHGTHVAGTIAARDNNLGVIGVAPEADLYSIKVLTDDGWGYWSWIVAGIEWCIENNMHVVNMSLGGSRDPGIEDIFNSAYQHGILLVAAAGNSGAGANTVVWPARYDSVIAVAAVDSADQRAWFSSTGPAVELAAPGVGVLSCVPGNNYEIHSGTSMACPHVVGSSALCWSLRTEMSNVDVRKWLQENALDLGSLGRDNSFGYGLVQIENLAFKQDIEFVAEAKAGKPFDWSFETEFHPLWFLKTQQKYGKTQDFQFETEYSPDWYLKTQQKYGKFQELQFQTELNPLWNLIVNTAAYKPYEFSFKTIFPSQEERFGPALVELYRPQKYEKKILTIPINWLFKGTQRELGFEVWYAKNQEKKVLDDLRLNIRTLTNTNEGGKEIVDNSWFKVKKIGNGGYSNPIDFSFGKIEPNSYYGVSFLLDIPASAQSLGFVTFALDFLGIDNVMYDEFSFGAALYSGVVLAKETVVVRAHVLNPM